MTEIDLASSLPQNCRNRKIISDQLFSGHMRIDLGRPLAKGNFIVFKGPSKQGKTSVTHAVIKQFLLENPNHRAIYVGLTQNSG